MKRIFVLGLAALFVLASCSSAGSSGPDPASPTRTPATGKIGIYEKPYEVGDIVFNDGSATPYTEINARTSSSKMTTEEKSRAIAVIFYKGKGLNNGDDTTTERTLGVGLTDKGGQLEWCKWVEEGNGANGYSIKIEPIVCTFSGTKGNFTFAGDLNGKDNLEALGSYLQEKSLEDDTLSSGVVSNFYPSFKFAKEYGNSFTGTEYTQGWFLPTLAEYFQIYKAKEKINIARNLCGKNNLEENWYWSSSQSDSFAISASRFNIKDGDCDDTATKKSNAWTCYCAIREFND